jgi:hypothetical protein
VPLTSFFDWFRALADPRTPWLLLGKGPSFSRLADPDLAGPDFAGSDLRSTLHGWRTFGLNHVCREVRVDVAHAIDFDVVEHCGARLLTHAGVVVMPWHPHVPDTRRPDWVRQAVRVSPLTLEEHADAHPVLRQLARDGRLLWYNLSSAAPSGADQAQTQEPGQRPGARPDSPVVRGRHFSAVAALNLLAMAGARTVRSLGVDGGTAYGSPFADLADRTRLAGGQRTYDLQFPEIGRTLVTTGLSYAPLDTVSPIRVFVGAAEAQQLPVRVLEHSIRRRTPMDVQVTPLYRVNIAIPEPREARNRGRTPFSFQRFLIPEAAGFSGRAIYLDSDMLVFDDLRDVWTRSMEDADLLGIETQDRNPTARFSVLLLNCERLRWKIGDVIAGLDAGAFTYEQLLYDMTWGPRVAGGIDPRWNRLDTYREGETALLHYTDVHRQPWVSTEHPLGYLWMRELFEALDDGFITPGEIAEAVAAGHVRPSLGVQVRDRIEDPLLLPRSARRLDLLYVEPFRLRPWGPTTGVARAGLVARASVRRAYRRSALFRLRTWVGERW